MIFLRNSGMGIVVGSCVQDDEPDTNQRYHHVVYGKSHSAEQVFILRVLSSSGFPNFVGNFTNLDLGKCIFYKVMFNVGFFVILLIDSSGETEIQADGI